MPIQPNTIVRLNDYCIAEFSQDQVSMSAIQYKLYNSSTGTHHIYNANGVSTGNNQDYSATFIAPSQFVYMDQEVSIPYWERFPDTYLATTPGAYDTFNRVRFHFTSGFDFAGITGLILSVKNKMNNGGYVFFTQLLITPDLYVDVMRYNPSPIYLADVMFDRFVEVFIPDVNVINQDYYNVPPESRSGEYGALLTYNGISYSGFIKDAPVIVSVDECIKIEQKSIGNDIYNIYTTGNHDESVVSVDSLHQRFGAYIGESAQFDAIEFYGTMIDVDGNLAFVEDLINLLSTNAHDKWVIAHQLTINEWIDGVKVLTGKFVNIQESNFDEPMYYRPILKNSGTAMAFEIDYTCRLQNQRNGDQLIRIASYISYNAAKYGKSLSQIPLQAKPESHTVYNKIVKSSLETTELFVEQNYVTTGGNVTQDLRNSSTMQVVTYVPMFFNVNAISVSQKDVLPDSDETDTTLIYKQGDLRFILNPFDNMFKFKVHTTNNRGLLIPMDLSGFGNFSIVLMNNNKKMKFAYLSDSGMSNPRVGELMFKIPQKDAEMLIMSNNREYYLTLTAADGTETVLYNGFWNDVTEKDVVDANNARVKAMQDEIKGKPAVNTTATTVGISTLSVESRAVVVEQPTVSTSGIELLAIESRTVIPAVSQFDTNAINGSGINIPGYVQQGNSQNDVSIAQKIQPTSSNNTTSSQQTKASASLASALNSQASLIPDAGTDAAGK